MFFGKFIHGQFGVSDDDTEYIVEIVSDAAGENAERFRRARPGRPAAFALNKSDLVDGLPHFEGAEDLAADFQGELIYTSAATGDQVPDLFRNLAGRSLVLDR